MADYQIINIKPGEWAIEESVRFFLFEGTEKALLVDTGATLEGVSEIVKSLTDKPVILVNTHTDIDHIHANGEFDCCYMHPAEYSYKKVEQYGWDVRPLWEGDIIDIGGRRFEVIETPGHTSGSICLLDRENRILLGGDVVQEGGIIYMYGPGRSMRAYKQSLERLYEKYGDAFDTVYNCHEAFPCQKALIPRLIEAADSVVSGKAEGKAVDFYGSKIWDYDCGVLHYYTNRWE